MAKYRRRRRHNPAIEVRPGRILIAAAVLGGAALAVDTIARHGALPEWAQAQMHAAAPERYPERPGTLRATAMGGGSDEPALPQIPAAVVALDNGNGTAQNYMVYPSGQRVPIGLPYAHNAAYPVGTPAPASVAPPQRLEVDLGNGWMQVYLVFPDGRQVQEGNPYPAGTLAQMAPSAWTAAQRGKSQLVQQSLGGGSVQQYWIYEDGSMEPCGPPFTVLG